MTAKKGTGLLMVWADVPADKEPEFNRWYNEEHLAERLAIPGFLNGARYEAVKGGPKHLAVYELESPAVLESAAYKTVATNPTPWTQRTGRSRSRVQRVVQHDLRAELRESSWRDSRPALPSRGGGADVLDVLRIREPARVRDPGVACPAQCGAGIRAHAAKHASRAGL